MISYSDVIKSAGEIEALGNVSYETLSITNLGSGQTAIVKRGATSWPLIVLGLTASCLDSSGGDASPLVLVRLRDAGSEQPFTDGFISVYSLLGPASRPNPMRLIKPFLLTRNRRIEIEAKNTGTVTVTLHVVLFGIRYFGDPLAAGAVD